MTDLADREFEPPSDDESPLTDDEIEPLLAELDDDVWEVVDGHHLAGTYSFDDFKGALGFAVELGALAEQLWHHPDLHVSWGEVRVELFTHSIDGLSEADFVAAARMDDRY